MRKAVITKDLVVKRLREGYYSFSLDRVNEEFRADLEKINFDLSGADLWKADLRKANLRNAEFNCVFCKTKVSKAQRKYILEETDLFEVVD